MSHYWIPESKEEKARKAELTRLRRLKERQEDEKKRLKKEKDIDKQVEKEIIYFRTKQGLTISPGTLIDSGPSASLAAFKSLKRILGGNSDFLKTDLWCQFSQEYKQAVTTRLETVDISQSSELYRFANEIATAPYSMPAEHQQALSAAFPVVATGVSTPYLDFPTYELVYRNISIRSSSGIFLVKEIHQAYPLKFVQSLVLNNVDLPFDNQATISRDLLGFLFINNVQRVCIHNLVLLHRREKVPYLGFEGKYPEDPFLKELAVSFAKHPSTEGQNNVQNENHRKSGRKLTAVEQLALTAKDVLFRMVTPETQMQFGDINPGPVSLAGALRGLPRLRHLILDFDNNFKFVPEFKPRANKPQDKPKFVVEFAFEHEPVRLSEHGFAKIPWQAEKYDDLLANVGNRRDTPEWDGPTPTLPWKGEIRLPGVILEQACGSANQHYPEGLEELPFQIVSYESSPETFPLLAKTVSFEVGEDHTGNPFHKTVKVRASEPVPDWFTKSVYEPVARVMDGVF
ncbi:hypothetical protein T439DRAFT_380358 [Meredithblackwellia eburnea MCA 4105]